MASDLAIPMSRMIDVESQVSVGPSTRANAPLKATHFQSEAEAIAGLMEMAVEKWDGQFGREVYNPRMSTWEMGGALQHVDFDISDPVASLGDGLGVAIIGMGYTNVQTDGVDEGDDVEISSDGYAFVFRDQAIRIIDMRDPSDLKQVAQIDTAGYSAQFHLVGNKLIVISQGLGFFPEARYGGGFFDSSVLPPNGALQTNVTMFDVADKSKPKLTANYNVEGTMSASRVEDNKLVLVLNAMPGLPEVNIVSPTNALDDATTSWPMMRYETKEEYIARIKPIILDSVLPNFESIGEDGKTISKGIVGDWSDITLTGGFEVTSVVTIDVASDAPKIGTSETIVGGFNAFTYVTHESIYLSSVAGMNAMRIVHFDFVYSNGELTADAVGEVKGVMRDSRFMDEFEGKLRVVTTQDGSLSGGRIRNSANLFVLQVEDGELETVGELLDISPGDQAYGVEFDGPRAFITTGFINPITLIQPFDPLHGIDLSDPTDPKELSDLVIPGITNYVQWLDSDHLIGVGLYEENSLWYTQVSLFDVADIANPKTMDVWQGTKAIRPNFWGAPNALDIHFDPVSKTLSIPQSEGTGFSRGWMWEPLVSDTIFWDPRSLPSAMASDVVVLSIDLESDDPIAFLAEVGDGTGMGRAVVVDDTLMALSSSTLSTYSIKNPTEVLDRIFISSPLRPDYLNIEEGTNTTIIDVLANDSLGSYTLTAIKGDQLRGTVRILPDQTLEYTVPANLGSVAPTAPGTIGLSWRDSFSYEVTTVEGAKFETMVSVFRQRKTLGDDNQQGSAFVLLKAVDAEGNPVASTAKGDEFWVEVQVQDGRTNPQGVFSAYLDIDFDMDSFEIVGDAEPLGDFTYGLLGEKTDAGWKNLGGFSDEVVPTGPGIQSVVRFKLRATQDAILTMSASTSTVAGNDMTLWGIDSAIPVANITSGFLQLPITVTPVVEKVLDYDVNDDGLVSPLDSLIVLNRINRDRELFSAGGTISANASNAKLDVNADGIISLLDVLTLINRINKPVAPTMNILMMNTQEMTEIAKKKSIFADAFFSDETMAFQ
jgi:hypothetical protein